MKIKFCMKSPDVLDHAAEELRGQVDEDEAQDILDRLRSKFRYGEYLDLVYDTETDTLEIT